MKTKFWDNLIKVVPVVSSDGCWNLQRSGWKKEKGENTCSHVELNYLLALTADVLKGHLNRSSKSCCRKYSHGICELQLLWGPAEMCLLLTINTIHLLSPAEFASLNTVFLGRFPSWSAISSATFYAEKQKSHLACSVLATTVWFVFLLTVALFHRRSLHQGNQCRELSLKQTKVWICRREWVRTYV